MDLGGGGGDGGRCMCDFVCLHACCSEALAASLAVRRLLQTCVTRLKTLVWTLTLSCNLPSLPRAYVCTGRLVVHKPDLPPVFSPPAPQSRLGGLGLPVGLSPRASRGASVAALREYGGPNAFAIPGNHGPS